MTDPHITDNDVGEITVTVNGSVIRGWSYKDDAERRVKMQMAHEFAEGWLQAVEATTVRLRLRIRDRLNNHLCGMKPDYDYSVVGFIEAWDVVCKIFDYEFGKTDHSMIERVHEQA